MRRWIATLDTLPGHVGSVLGSERDARAAEEAGWTVTEVEPVRAQQPTRRLAMAFLGEITGELSGRDGEGGAWFALEVLDAFEQLAEDGWSFTPPKEKP